MAGDQMMEPSTDRALGKPTAPPRVCAAPTFAWSLCSLRARRGFW
eukprot:CAMPEP_0170217560 /NCGR_PEP_ID=MMETSP0116_2-20130129/8445_1 /TAXON_ID=400756 /ORGANISM="Durinskia baltica, Strain CSIRO CS-38" /LENGTH=44 /DNA_ID= /DNA_START= /DNA_END= /DNA_ORIENTATION=